AAGLAPDDGQGIRHVPEPLRRQGSPERFPNRPAKTLRKSDRQLTRFYHVRGARSADVAVALTLSDRPPRHAPAALPSATTPCGATRRAGAAAPAPDPGNGTSGPVGLDQSVTKDRWVLDETTGSTSGVSSGWFF